MCIAELQMAKMGYFVLAKLVIFDDNNIGSFLILGG